jgi:hypothetical protein
MLGTQGPDFRIWDRSTTTAFHVRAHTPASATTATKQQTPPRTPASTGRNLLWLCAALLCDFGFGGSSVSQTSVSRDVMHGSTRLHAAPSAQNPFSLLLIE